MYKLRPEDFQNESDVTKLIKYLEESPLNKQPLPDAGSKIGGYYRRLQRKPMEGVNAFLIREDKLHDDMFRALQRLLREKELNFDEYDMDMEELRRFCGFQPGQSMYFGDPEDYSSVSGDAQEHDEGRTATPRGSHVGKPFTNSSRSSPGDGPATSTSSSASRSEDTRRGKDLLERLMEKGLVPLAALDIIRGWLVLEMAVSSEEDRRLIKAATRNQLAYSAIRTALLGLFEEKNRAHQPMPHRMSNHNKVYYQEAEYEYVPEYNEQDYYGYFNEDFYGNNWDNYDPDSYEVEHGSSWTGEEAYEAEQWPEEDVEDEDLMRLQEQQEEYEKNKKELEALLGETDRNLVEARKAVAAAQKDRGWTGTVQQRQPRSTTTFPGKSKGKGKFSPPGAGRGKGGHFDGHWMKGKNKGGQGRFGNGYGKGKGRYKNPAGSNYHLGMMEVQDEHVYPMMMAANPVDSSSSKEGRLPPEQSLVDTGATATAGGKQAVKDLCKALVAARPNVKLDIFQSARPWFRFGNGKWGRALYKVTITDVSTNVSMSIYALPAVDVPVLTGMKELRGLQAILNCSTGACVLKGKPMTLMKNQKEHLIVDYLKHIFPPTEFHGPSNEPNRSTSSITAFPTSCATPRVTFAEQVEECHVIDIFALDFQLEEDFFFAAEVECSNDLSQQEAQDLARHLGVTDIHMQHLLHKSTTRSSSLTVSHGREPQRRDSRCGPRGGARGDTSGSRGSQTRDQGHIGRTQEEVQQAQDRAGSNAPDGRGHSRPSSKSQSMAMFWQSRGKEPRQQIRRLDGMQSMRSPSELCPGSERTGTDNPCRSSTKCDTGTRAPSDRWLGGSGDHRDPGEGHHHHCVQGVPGQEAQGQGLQAERCHEDGSSQGQEQVTSGRSQHGQADGDCRQRQRVRESGRQGQETREGSAESAGDKVIAYVTEGEPLGEATRQRLMTSTTEFNSCSCLGALQDFVKPFIAWEVCCRANSSLSEACGKQKIQAQRKTLETGYDIGKPSDVNRLREEATQQCPARAWFSLKCTAITSIQRLNQRDWQQMEDLRKKRQSCRKQLRGAIAVLWAIIVASLNQSKFYFEWPKYATDGWNLPEMLLFQRQYEKMYGKLYFTQIDGCQHGMKSPDGYYIQKSWLVMHNDHEFHDRCYAVCDRSHEHRPGGMIGMGSKAVSETAFYPHSMVVEIAKLWRSQAMRQFMTTPEEISNTLLVAMDKDQADTAGKTSADKADLSKIPAADVERTTTMLHRLHRAAGHPSNRALARLCQDRGLPPWVSQLALQLRCQACTDTKKGGQMVIPASIEARPQPWQMLGLDVFELYFPKLKLKARYLLTVCLTMRFVSVHLVWEGDIATAGTDSGQKLIHAFVESSLLHRPRPEWLLVDAQTSLSKGDFVAFCQSIGVGVSVVPGEAHWQHGATESMVKALKSTRKKLRSEQPSLGPKLCALLSAMAQNHVDRVKGFSPVQWAYGLEPGQWHLEHDPLEVNKNNNMNTAEFWQVQKNREKVEEVYRRELAASRMTRLHNASSRPTSAYQIGDWVCVWRSATLKARKGTFQNEPRFIGPGRIALIEPAVLPEGRAAVYWVLMGTAVWRCAPEQLRPASEVEIIAETAKMGDKAATPMSELLRQLHSSVDVTKEPKFDPEQDLLPEQPQLDGAPDPDGEQLAEPADRWQQFEDEEDTRSRQRSRSREAPETRHRRVQEHVDAWNKLDSVNKARRLEGLPPLSQLPSTASSSKPDEWEYVESEGRLVRHHYNDRWTLFNPTSTDDCPVYENFIQPEADSMVWSASKWHFQGQLEEGNWRWRGFCKAVDGTDRVPCPRIWQKEKARTLLNGWWWSRRTNTGHCATGVHWHSHWESVRAKL